MDITQIAATITALGVISGAIFAVYKEQTILTQGILACLQGLHEQGCNGPVTAAIERIETHLNKQAHK